MPCSVLGCSGKDSEGKILKCYRFPSDKHYRDLWTYLCRKKEEVSSEARVCDRHFSSNQYVKDLQAERLGTKPRKLLKTLAVPDINLPPVLHGNMITMSQMVQEVRELYLGMTQPSGPFTCNAMSPKVILIQLTQKYIDKHTMPGQVENEALSEEESWEADNQECDMNLLEPLVEISDNANDKNKKRKNSSHNEDNKKRGRSSTNQSQSSVPKESLYLNVPIKQEPVDPPSELQPLSLQDASLSGIPMATIPVGNSDSPLPVYRVDTGDLNPLTQQSSVIVNSNEKDSVQNGKKKSTNKKTTKDNTNMVKIKQEDGEMANVFVMPFGADIEQQNTERTSENRAAAIAAGIELSGSTSNQKLRELTQKLVELTNKSLQCDSKIDKIKDDFKKRLQVAEIEKKGIEQEVDGVLNAIQEWKDARKQQS